MCVLLHILCVQTGSLSSVSLTQGLYSGPPITVDSMFLILILKKKQQKFFFILCCMVFDIKTDWMAPMYEFRLSIKCCLGFSSPTFVYFYISFYLVKIMVMICRLVIGYIEMVT